MHQRETIQGGVPSVQDIEKFIVEIEESKGKLKDLDCGDMVIKDSGDLGFDVYRKDGQKIMFLNKIGERVLLDWLIEKNKDNAAWVEKNFKRIKKENNGSWRRNDNRK
jgi:hypothetical protein